VAETVNEQEAGRNHFWANWRADGQAGFPARRTVRTFGWALEIVEEFLKIFAVAAPGSQLRIVL
jgi:hypothetical protein